MYPMLRGSMLMLVLVGGAAAMGSTDPDGVAIRATARDYIEAYYTADVVRMEHALHPDVVKRSIITDPKTHRSAIASMGARMVIERTRDGVGRSIPDGRRREDLTVLDRVDDTAMVKIVAADSIDFLQMAKLDGEWKIVNVLWSPRAISADPPAEGARPRDGAESGASAGKQAPPARPATCPSRFFMLI